MKKICKNCKWYSSVLIEPRVTMFYVYEFCKRFPPHPVHGHSRTTEGNTCGEFDLSYEAIKNAPIDEL